MTKAPICSCGLSMLERRNKVTRKPFYGCAKFGKGGCGETASHEDVEIGESSFMDSIDLD